MIKLHNLAINLMLYHSFINRYNVKPEGHKSGNLLSLVII